MPARQAASSPWHAFPYVAFSLPNHQRKRLPEPILSVGALQAELAVTGHDIPGKRRPVVNMVVDREPAIRLSPKNVIQNLLSSRQQPELVKIMVAAVKSCTNHAILQGRGKPFLGVFEVF